MARSGNAAQRARKEGTKTAPPGSKRNTGPDGLNDKQRQFCAEYLIDLNGAAAARRAGYSEKTARTIAQELLVKPECVAVIQSLMAERAQRTQVTADNVITELAKIGFADIRKLFAGDGTLLPVYEWPDGMAAAVSSVEVDALFEGAGIERKQIGVTQKVKLWDKPKSLELLGRHLKLWVERIEASGPNGGPIETKNDGVDLANLTDEELEQLERLRHAADSRRAGR